MPSLRDKLKAKNAENAAERGNTSTEDTVFADFINRTEPEQDVENKLSEEKHPVQEENNKQDKESDAPEKNPVKKETAKQPVKQKAKTKKLATESNSKENVKAPDKIEEKSDKETNELTLQKNERQVTLTISIPPEIDEYLNIKPAMLAEPIKKVFTDSIIKAVNCPVDNTLASQFRKTQHSCFKRTIQVSESFREVIRKEAVNFKMKPTSFITYCLTKVYNEDEEYQKAMTEDK